MIAMLRPQPHAGAIVELHATAWLLPLRHLQPFASPDPGAPGKLACWGGDALHAILAHVPTHLLQLDRDAYDIRTGHTGWPVKGWPGSARPCRSAVSAGSAACRVASLCFGQGAHGSFEENS